MKPYTSVALLLTGFLAFGQAAAQAPKGEIRESLGAGDSVRVTVFQNPDLTTETRVSERGTVMFPLVGEVRVAGDTPAGAANRIADQLKKGNFLKNPQVAVQVMTVRSRQVSVLGQVARPGRYALDETKSTVTDLIAAAGGTTPIGDDRVTLVREEDGKTIRREVDVSRIYANGDTKDNVEVRNGDLIYVQRAPMFYIYGEVQKAGAYRLEPGLSVMHALSLGGGLTPRGTERGMRIHRRAPDGSVKHIDAKPGDAVQADDVVFVKESLF